MIKKTMTTTFILIILLMLALGVVFFMKKSSQAVVTGYRDFSCKGWNDFSFRYPMFKSLPSVTTETQDDICVLHIGESDTYGLVTITLQRGSLSNMTSDDYKKTFNNRTKSGVLYRLEEREPKVGAATLNKKMKLEFFTDDSNSNVPNGVSIKSMYLPVTGKVQGFDEDIFFGSIVDSFALTTK